MGGVASYKGRPAFIAGSGNVKSVDGNAIEGVANPMKDHLSTYDIRPHGICDTHKKIHPNSCNWRILCSCNVEHGNIPV